MLIQPGWIVSVLPLRLRELSRDNTDEQHIKSNAGVYTIPCNNCKMKYIGKTVRNLKKWLYEHKCDIRLGNSNNPLFLRISKTNHNFNFYAAAISAPIHNKRLRQIFEASAISPLSSVNICSEFFNLSPFLGKLVLNSYNISNFNYFFLLTYLYFHEPHKLNSNLSSWTIRSYSFSLPFLHFLKITYSNFICSPSHHLTNTAQGLF